MIDARPEPRENEELQSLIAAAWNGDMETCQRDRLEELLLADDRAAELYLTCMAMHGRLLWQHRGATERVKQWVADRGESDDFDGSVRIPEIVPAPCADPARTLIGSLSQSGWMLSYLTASVILAVMLLGAWAYKISHDVQIAVPTVPKAVNDLQAVYVAQVTGMDGCRQADGELPIYLGSPVAIGHKYLLASGLLELTYRDGARVILEGPCEYTVDSSAGGFLRVGKLVARVEERGERRGERGEGLTASAASEKLLATSHWPLATNPQSPVPGPQPPLSTLHSPLFTVTTPTAVVTDLGTEFGVKVDTEGNTSALVFSGTVKVEMASEKAKEKDGCVTLLKNESAHICKLDGDGSLVLRQGDIAPEEFSRNIAKLPEALDLLDIVAGGNGMGQHRENGINPATGAEDRVLPSQYREPGPGYRPWYTNVSWHNLIDGVFVPDGRMGKVRINSAGYRFDGFPKTDGKAFGSIWARDARAGKTRRKGGFGPWIYAVESAERYMPENRGLLGLHANAGITFDLGAMREAYRGARPARFRATAAVADIGVGADGQCADVWVFVDSRLELHRSHLGPRDGVLAVNIELGPNDRFMTLVSTDGEDGSADDCVVFGDPTLEMISTTKAADRGGIDKTEESGK